METWLYENCLDILVIAFFFFFLFRSGLVDWFISQRTIKVWKVMAVAAGFTELNDSIQKNPIAGQFYVRGRYRDRMILLIPGEDQAYRFWPNVTIFKMKIINESTLQLPGGAFLVIKQGSGDEYFFSSPQPKENADLAVASDLREKFIMQSIPKNLVNHMLLKDFFRVLLSHPHSLSLVIDRQEMIFHFKGLLRDQEQISVFLNALCDLGDWFERFSRNWLR